VLSIDGACILVNVVIVDTIHAIKNSIHPIVLKIASFKKVGITVATQVKDGNYMIDTQGISSYFLMWRYIWQVDNFLH
jgi:hypothetical protein